MTSHLGDTEFIDRLDGVLPAARQQHLDGCPACRERLDAIEQALALTAADPVPEPSPLFWDHLSARVRGAIAAEPPPASVWRQLVTAPAFAALAAGAAAVCVLVTLSWQIGLAPSTPQVTTGAVTLPAGDQSAQSSGELPAEAVEDLEADEAWALVRSVADELEVADIDAAGIAPRPGAAERVAHELSDLERIELADLLEHEIKTGAATAPSL
jgi:hypothetical protein